MSKNNHCRKCRKIVALNHNSPNIKTNIQKQTKVS